MSLYRSSGQVLQFLSLVGLLTFHVLPYRGPHEPMRRSRHGGAEGFETCVQGFIQLDAGVGSWASVVQNAWRQPLQLGRTF